jgi:hypothetical protein
MIIYINEKIYNISVSFGTRPRNRNSFTCLNNKAHLD